MSITTPPIGADPEDERDPMKQSAMAAFKAFVQPVFQRPEFVQAAALCLRKGVSGTEVLLVSSLNTKRWIVPKGWPMEGRSLAEAAAQEAWEEAGVRGTLYPKAEGDFAYRKMVKDGIPVSCRCQAYRIDVEELADDWPEQGRRKRQWFSPKAAAKRVEEPELKALLRKL